MNARWQWWNTSSHLGSIFQLYTICIWLKVPWESCRIMGSTPRCRCCKYICVLRYEKKQLFPNGWCSSGRHRNLHCEDFSTIQSRYKIQNLETGGRVKASYERTHLLDLQDEKSEFSVKMLLWNREVQRCSMRGTDISKCRNQNAEKRSVIKFYRLYITELTSWVKNWYRTVPRKYALFIAPFQCRAPWSRLQKSLFYVESS